MHGNSTQRSSLAGGVGMGEKLALWCKEAKIQIASLVLQPLLLFDNEQRKSDQLLYGWSPLAWAIDYSVYSWVSFLPLNCTSIFDNTFAGSISLWSLVSCPFSGLMKNWAFSLESL